MRLLLLAGLLMLGAQTCMAQEGVTTEQLVNFDGLTVCWKGQGHSFVSTDLSPKDEAAVRVHEAKHREQYTRFKDCKEFNAWYHTPRGAMQSEAEAFHAGWCVLVRMGEDSTAWRNDFVGRIERALGGEVNRLEVVMAFRKYDPCSG